MARTIAEVWLSTCGHGVYEHLGTVVPRPGRRTPEPRNLRDPRAEALLCGCLAFYGNYARQGAARVGLQGHDFTVTKARTMWAGGSDPAYRAFVMAEYDWAADEVLAQWCERRVAGLEAKLYDAGATEIAEALAGHIVRLAQVRAKLAEAEQLLSGKTAPQRRRTGVAL